ncbi:unnamed protein product [Brassica rapa]|uniref:Secreted protein n=1 Tax=Brassica campestris TaxID=3711 RepID=A0A3P6BST0_BRACM|nr:unnamed protein product [Brassica rapa]VDD00311.1 unnamed protein product [Brassica rapa]
MHAHMYIIASILLHATGESGYSCKYLKGVEGNLYVQYGCKGIFSYIFICDFLDHENLVLKNIDECKMSFRSCGKHKPVRTLLDLSGARKSLVLPTRTKTHLELKLKLWKPAKVREWWNSS